VLFQVVGMYENSASVARIMIVVADHVKVDEWPRFGWYMVGRCMWWGVVCGVEPEQ
jgi:hypothetical protein